ncbi:MAG: hypothetical protein K6U74_02280 [Firmicutes bacterium]|nr:hypothetical protein [Bacillota bacterium]
METWGSAAAQSAVPETGMASRPGGALRGRAGRCAKAAATIFDIALPPGQGTPTGITGRLYFTVYPVTLKLGSRGGLVPSRSFRPPHPGERPAVGSVCRGA